MNATGELLSTTPIRLLLCIISLVGTFVFLRSSAADRGATRFGRVLAIGCAAAIGVVLLQALVGVTRIGITNDEPVHVSRTNAWLETGWYVPAEWIEADGQVRDTIPETKLQTYGAAFGLTAHAVGVTAGVESLGESSLSSEAFAVRRSTSVMVGALGALAVGRSMAVVTGRRSIAWWAAAATMAMPLWTGYSMFAIKDTPAATGYSLVTAGCVLALAPGLSRRRGVAAAAFIALGVWFGFGTRIGLWVPLFATVVIALAHGCLLGPRDLRRQTALTIGVPASVAALAVAAIHRNNAGHPVRWLVDAAVRSADFDDSVRLTLTAGRLLGTTPPWWYLPAWVGASVPLIVGTLALAGITLTVGRLVGGRSGGTRDRLARADSLMLFWLMQAAALPMVGIALGATIYGGLRQHIYTLPALAALAAYAVHRMTSPGSDAAVVSVKRRALVGLVAALAVVLPTIDQLAMNPYAFVYKNDLAGPIDDRWETDLHSASTREALWNLPTRTQVLCYRQSTVNPAEVPVILDCTRIARLETFLSEIGRNGVVDEPGDHVWVLGRRSNGSPPLTGCESAANVTRRLHGATVTMYYVLRCDPKVIETP